MWSGVEGNSDEWVDSTRPEGADKVTASVRAVHMVLAARMVVGARNLSALQNNDVIFKI